MIAVKKCWRRCTTNSTALTWFYYISAPPYTNFRWSSFYLPLLHSCFFYKHAGFVMCREYQRQRRFARIQLYEKIFIKRIDWLSDREFLEPLDILGILYPIDAPNEYFCFHEYINDSHMSHYFSKLGSFKLDVCISAYLKILKQPYIFYA